MGLSSLLRLNFLICKLEEVMVRKWGGRDGKMLEKVQGTVNYYVNKHKEIDKLAPSQLFTPHKRLFEICSISFQGPRAKMEETGLHLPVLLAGALSAPAL